MRDLRRSATSRADRHAERAATVDTSGRARADAQALVGNATLAAAQAGAAEGPLDLYCLHLLELAASSSLDFGPYLPGRAPPSWIARIAPYYQVLWERTSASPSTGGGPLEQGQTDAPDSVLDTGDMLGANLLPEAPQGAPSDIDGPEGPDVAMEGVLVAAARARQAGSNDAPGFEQERRRIGAGRPLTDEEQAFLAGVLGRPAPLATIHEGAGARSLSASIDARAFTVGSDIYVGTSSTQLSDPDWAELLAHEAMHVVQHAAGHLPAAPGAGLHVSSPSDPHEREAEAVGRRGRAATISPEGLALDTAPDGAGRAILAWIGAALEPDAGPAEHEPVAPHSGGPTEGETGAGAAELISRDEGPQCRPEGDDPIEEGQEETSETAEEELSLIHI